MGRGRLSADQHLKFTLREAPVPPEATFLILDLPVGVDTEIQAALPANLTTTTT